MTALPSQNGEVVGCVSSSAQWWFGSTFSRHVWEPHGCPTGVEGRREPWRLRNVGVIGCV